MQMDYRTALLDQLDPTRQKKQGAAALDLGDFVEPGGVAGQAPPLAPSAPDLPASPLADAPGPMAAPAAPAANFGRTMGFDAGKFNDSNKHDFKYDTGRVLSRFDPRQGFTPDVINALNSELGGTYGTYAGSGDKLSLTGAKGAKDAGDFGPQDWIGAFKANNDDTKWNFGGGAVANAEAAQGGGGRTIGGASPILQGNAMGNIDTALSTFGAAPDFIQQLLAKLQQGA